ncbi:hypothetical protein HBH98_213720 [Parastagonospora nodorum]|nr:hypothetical protein HBH50_230680 [Parastagonospora nodorum]KAH4079162.1 hypothetical protein HBH48_224150 [Parastagonospora nodorum]KAH4155370.1 hypothetical protein HBH43_211570 [Parastagonospora nodorum]KAH4338017.1 hypothetical protein HBH98_213720 [Parastagonospora nodorum]KAH4361038.1 hypothetical protein HBH97_202070 [Parastagonospora nodorum]
MDLPEFVQVNLSTTSPDRARLNDNHDSISSIVDGSALQTVFRDSGPWPAGLAEATQPVPIFLPKSRMSELQQLCESIHLAVCDIIDRWWDDSDARFWERMPLDPRAEAVLRWISERKGPKGQFRKISGFWRPDVLISDNPSAFNKTSTKASDFGPFKVCEINCRYPLSGYIVASTLETFHSRHMSEHAIFQTTVGKVDSVIERKFSPYKVIWFLHGENIQHVDLINMSSYFRKQGLGEARFVRPEHLSVEHDPNSASGRKLVATTSASDLFHQDETHTRMQIDLIVIEARQAQLINLPKDVLEELALRSVNDLRSIFLAHDKRMLAIILSELDNLVSKRRVLSHTQSECLSQGLAQTYIAKSRNMLQEIEKLRNGKESKDNWVLKPIASGKGKGIVFGTDIPTKEKFCDLLEANECTGAYVLQRVVDQPRFPMVSAIGESLVGDENNKSHLSTGPLRYLVGTFMMSDGQFLGTLWRASPEPICAFAQGAWLLNAVTERASVKPYSEV